MMIKELFLPFQAKYCFITIVVLLECAYLFQIMFRNQSWKSNTVTGIILDLQLDIYSASSLFSFNSTIFHNMALNFNIL